MKTIRLRLDGLVFVFVILFMCFAFVHHIFDANAPTLGRSVPRQPQHKEDSWLLDSDDTLQQPANDGIVGCINKTLPLPENIYILQPGTDTLGADLGSILSRDTLLMRKVCDVLPECKGFNSNGWLKKSVEKTKEVPTTDLYMKQVLFTPKPNPKPHDEDGEINEIIPKDNFGAAFHDMMASLKIFVYTSELDAKVTRQVHWKYAVESLFIKLLSKSQFITKDADEANFFFLPFRCATYRNVIRDRNAAQNYTESLVNDIMEDIKSRYTYWDRSLGADHFYVCGHDMGASSVASADPNLSKNAIALVNTADYADPHYVPHKDIALPPHPAHGKGSLPDIARGGETSKARPNLAFYAGNLNSGRLRSVFKQWLNDTDFLIHDGHLSDSAYVQQLLSAKFCLVLRGHRVWSPVLIDAVWAGCVPVIISDYYDLPLNGLVDWAQFAVFLKEKEVFGLKNKLLNVSAKKLKKMQNYIKQVYHHFVWNDPPQLYDAFHSVLFQLWKKRDVVRYV